MEVTTSDHCPIFMEPKVVINPARSRNFKFENAWLREPMCLQIVKDIWQCHHNKSIQDKIQLCSKVLSKWGKEITSGFKDRIAKHKKVLRSLKGRRDDRFVKLYQDASLNYIKTLRISWKKFTHSKKPFGNKGLNKFGSVRETKTPGTFMQLLRLEGK